MPAPNHKCGYCGREYYACYRCDRISYRKYACSPECYEQIAWRIIPGYPKPKSARTDLTDEEQEELDKKSMEEITNMSIDELSEYSDELNEVGFDGVVDMINKQNEREAK